MSRLVMDVLFCEIVQFIVPMTEFRRCCIQVSQEEVLREALVTVGLELIDYGSWTGRPDSQCARVHVTAYSKAYRERAERATALR